VREAEKHLTTEQIEQLGKTQRLEIERGVPVDQEARRHWATCETCRRLVLMHEDFDRRLRGLKDVTETSPGPACPAADELWEMVCGVSPKERAEELLEHAIGCGYCAPRLQGAIKIFEEQPTESELAQMSALASATAPWQAELAHRLASSAAPAVLSVSSTRTHGVLHRGLERFLVWPYVAAAATMLIALTATAIWLGMRQTPIQQLLAQAYSEQRTSDLRISGASYAPLRVERGGTSSRLSRPAALLEAEARIAKEYLKRPEDGSLLAAKGRAELLEGNFDDAVRTLQTAQALLPNANSVRIDLASAYSGRAQAKNQPWDDGQAVELLLAILRQDPREPVAIFNVAIILERQNLYNEAVQRWRLYLSVDPASDWASEARKHLTEDEQKLRKVGSVTPLFNPGAAARFEVSTTPWDSRAEDYLREATVVWLPKAFDKDPSQNSQVFLSALRQLAILLATQHGDLWLADLLRQTNSRDLPSGLNDLASAIGANETGDYAGAAIQAHAAAHKLISNRAAYLRARFEEAYSARLSHDARRCKREITPVLHELAQRQYAWLSAQAVLEQQECLNMLGDVGGAAALSNVTMAGAQHSHYPALAARALLFAADIDDAAGNVASAWRRTHAGLEESWSAGLPVMRIYSFETELEALANRAGQSQFDAAVIRDSLKTIERDPNPLMRAAEHHRLAETALLVDDYVTAEEQFKIAGDLFSSAPSSPVTEANRLETVIWLSRVEVQRGQFADARHRLQNVRGALGTVSNRYLLTDYFQIMGRAELGLGDLPASDRSLQSALTLTERALRSLRSETERLNWERESSSVYRDLVSLRLKQGNPAGALATWEWYRASPLRGSAGAQSLSGSKSTIEAMLPSLNGETILSFAFRPGGIDAWVYDDRGISHQAIVDPSAALPELIRQFAAVCASPTSPPSAVRALGRKLYDAVLAPVRRYLLPQRLLIVEPDGPLWSLPFAALIDPEGKYVADTFTLSQLPGIYYGRILQTGARLEKQGALVVAASDSVSFDGGTLPALPNAVSEARRVARLLPGATLLTSGSVYAADLRARLLNIGMFHFAGHAVVTSEESFLVLSPNSDGSSATQTLSSADIAGLPLHSLRLAVLSGCTTATGPAGYGLIDGHNLADAFLRAGTAQVLAARWSIDSAATESFMAAFYTALVSGKTATQAARAGAFHVRSLPGRTHPYYWAAFDIFGRA